MLRRLLRTLVFLVAMPALARAADPALTFRSDGGALSLTASQLLARGDVARITVPDDVAYGTTMTYQAVPVLSLLAEAKLPAEEPIEVRALDGFVAQFPAGVLTGKGPDAARAYLAVEPPGAPWPKLQGQDRSAGPFYLVWLNPKAAGIGSEYWPYQVASFESVPDPRVRWPQIDLARTVPAHDPARRGLEVFIENCIACHKINGGGESMVGPDLNLPMNPTEYFRPEVLRAFIRDPESVRTWPDRGMTGFEVDALSEEELDDLLAYLRAMSKQRG